MLKNTFCHIPGIGEKRESRLWSSGIHSWDDFIAADSTVRMPAQLAQSGRRYVEESLEHLEAGSPAYFTGLLASDQHWRLFREFRSSVAYLDIETTGLGGVGDYITTISLYDGSSISCYIRGRNLDDFERDIGKYKVIVTYNGRCFDIPFIENDLGIVIDHAQIDLRYVLGSLGIKGGLKRCERFLGIERGDVEGIDGFGAVLLWKEFLERDNEKALETLLAYNIRDAVNLETLMVISYNLKIRATPFSEIYELPLPGKPPIPFKADRATVRRIISSYGLFS